METNENKNSPKSLGCRETVVRGKLIVIQAYLTKQKSQSNLTPKGTRKRTKKTQG